MADLIGLPRSAIRRHACGAWLLTLTMPAMVGGCHPAAPAASAEPAAATNAESAVAAATPDPYHPPPRDTVDAPLYKAWQQYSLQCARCHGEDAQGSSFGPSLLTALKPDGEVPTRDEFLHVLGGARSEKGMPSAEKMGIDSVYFDGLYDYLKGRSDGRFHGGRPARRD